MIERLIDISEGAAHLSARGELFVISRKDAEPLPRGARRHSKRLDPPPESTVPLSEIAAVVAAAPGVTFSRSAAARLAAHNAILVVCDDTFRPAAMMLPLTGNYVQAERFAQQAAAPLPLKKRLWQQIVAAKVTAQAHLLKDWRENDSGLAAMALRVRSGDSDNIEAQAARIYWPALFDDPDFRRERHAGGPNALLNYGYTVLRAVTARALCAAGLHPALGLHHHNRYDPFCLASDIMEPLRPLVDRAALALVEIHGPGCILDRNARAALLSALTGRLDVGGEQRSLFDTCARMAASLTAVFAGKRKSLVLPEPDLDFDARGDHDHDAEM